MEYVDELNGLSMQKSGQGWKTQLKEINNLMLRCVIRALAFLTIKKHAMKSFLAGSLILLMLSPFVGKSILGQVETPPSCVITYPHNNAYYQEGTDLLIRVYATGIGGTGMNRSVEKVEFFVDGNKVHETSTHSFDTYSFLWEDLEAGTYRITARATNDQSVAFTSAGVFVTVGAEAVVKRG